MRIAKFLLGTILFVVGLPTNAQSLWQESEFGMTPAQVQERFPNAHPTSSPGTLHGGAIELLRISDIEIVGNKFKSSFFFKDNRLIQVTLSLADRETAHGAKLVFDSLSETLRAKYGAELSKDASGGIMTTLSSTWISGRTNITLYYNVIGQSDPILNLIYQVRLSAEADKI